VESGIFFRHGVEKSVVYMHRIMFGVYKLHWPLRNIWWMVLISHYCPNAPIWCGDVVFFLFGFCRHCEYCGLFVRAIDRRLFVPIKLTISPSGTEPYPVWDATNMWCRRHQSNAWPKAFFVFKDFIFKWAAFRPNKCFFVPAGIQNPAICTGCTEYPNKKSMAWQFLYCGMTISVMSWKNFLSGLKRVVNADEIAFPRQQVI